MLKIVDRALLENSMQNSHECMILKTILSRNNFLPFCTISIYCFKCPDHKEKM